MAAHIFVRLESVLIRLLPQSNFIRRQIMLTDLLVSFQIKHVPFGVPALEVLHLRHHSNRFRVRNLARHLTDVRAVRLSHKFLVLLCFDLLLELHVPQLLLADETLLNWHLGTNRILLEKSLFGKPQVLLADLGLERFILTAVLVLRHRGLELCILLVLCQLVLTILVEGNVFLG